VIAANHEEATESDLPPIYEGSVDLAGGTRLPFPTHTFDAVLFETDIVPVSEAVRVLRAGGCLLLPEPKAGSLLISLEHSRELSIPGVLAVYRRRSDTSAERSIPVGSLKGDPNAD
jgi:hypothetical protein